MLRNSGSTSCRWFGLLMLMQFFLLFFSLMNSVYQTANFIMIGRRGRGEGNRGVT